MKLTDEQLKKANMPLPDELHAKIGRHIAQMAWMPRKSDWEKLLGGRWSDATNEQGRLLGAYHTLPLKDFDGRFGACNKAGSYAMEYIRRNSRGNRCGPLVPAFCRLEIEIRKTHYWHNWHLKNDLGAYRRDVKELEQRYVSRRARKNWGIAKKALTDQQKAAFRKARTGEYIDYLSTSVRKLFAIDPGGPTYGEHMPRTATGQRDLLTLHNEDLKRATPTGKHNYWLELIDPKHRSWGHQIGNLYKVWLGEATHLNFFDWLDKTGNAKGLESVHYLDPSQRWRYKVQAASKKLQYPDDKGSLHTFSTKKFSTAFSGRGFAIWVCGPKGDFYSGNHTVNVFHHSSFLAGSAVFGAGEWAVLNGELIFLTGKTGHYRTPPEKLFSILRLLSRLTVVDRTLVELRLSQGDRYVLGGDFIKAGGNVHRTKVMTPQQLLETYKTLKFGKTTVWNTPIRQMQDMVRKRMAQDPVDMEPPAAPPPIKKEAVKKS